MIRSYRDLLVWQKAMDLVMESYRVAERLPKHETFGLAGQIRRAAVGIPANIAEGHGREHLGDYLRFLSIANGSLMELETHFIIAQKLGYIAAECADRALLSSAEIGRMLSGLSRTLRKRQSPDT